MSYAKGKQQSYFCPSCEQLLEKCQCEKGQDRDHTKGQHDCASWGCPLWGSRRAGDKWHCSWHARHPVTMADEISQWANRNYKLIVAERKLANLGPVCWNRSRWAKASIPPEPNESYFAYLARLSAAVGGTFLAEVHKRPAKSPQGESHELPL